MFYVIYQYVSVVFVCGGMLVSNNPQHFIGIVVRSGVVVQISQL
jgi:hypothetical protein